MKEIIQVASFIKARLLNNRNLLSQISLCSGSEYNHLLHIVGLDGYLRNYLLPLRFSNCNIVCLCVCVCVYNKINYVRQHYLFYLYIRLRVSTHQSVIFRPT